MPGNPRIDELRRRVQSDPASIAFAALAEEYRRAGQFEDAIAACKAGLRRHPAYLSAHVTLGRSLLEVGQYEEAREELEHVLKLAPENLAAIRGLAEIHHRLGGGEPEQTQPAVPSRPAPIAPARANPEAASHVSGNTGATSAAPRAVTIEPAAAIPLARTDPDVLNEPAPWEIQLTASQEPAAPQMPVAAREPAPPIAVDRRPPAPTPIAAPEPVVDPALPKLEELLAAILRARSELEDAGLSRRL
jgi:tetratricopeptide (TPR) repeat protein